MNKISYILPNFFKLSVVIYILLIYKTTSVQIIVLNLDSTN